LSGRVRPAQAGVSIVETVFAVMVLAILLSVAAPAYNSWIERHRVRAVTETMHAGIQLARAEALARNATVRIDIGDRGSWSIACTALTPGCPDLSTLHQRNGEENKGSFTLTVTPSTATGVSFGPQGRTVGSGITQLDVATAASVDAQSPLRALRLTVSSSGRSRMCYPHSGSGNAITC
jgi:type IV fimbrial biogenesis protein FimT